MGRRQRDRGAAAVEFALVVPILLLLVFGIIEFGRVYNIQTSITAAAREGARAVALGGDKADMETAVTSAAAPYAIDLSRITPTPAVCPNPNTANTIVKVTVTYQVKLLTNWFSTQPITLTGTGVMRCNG